MAQEKVRSAFTGCESVAERIVILEMDYSNVLSGKVYPGFGRMSHFHMDGMAAWTA